MQAFFYIDGIPTKGIWIDLDSISDFDEVLEELADANLIQRNGDDEPEYGGDVLVADVEGDLVKAFYSPKTDSLDLSGFVDCRDDCDRKRIDYDAAAAFLGHFGTNGWSLRDFENAYRGEADSEKEYAENYVDEARYLDEMPEHLRGYFDYEAFARDLFINDFVLVDGYVFDRNW